MAIRNLVLAPGIVLESGRADFLGGYRAEVLIDGGRYGPADIVSVQEFMQTALTRYEGFIATEQTKSKPNTALIAQLNRLAGLLTQGIELLNPGGPAIRAIDEEEAAIAARDAARQAAEEAAPPPPTPTIDNTTAPPPPDPAGNNSLQGAASDDSGAQPTTPTSSATAEAGASPTPTPTPILPGGAPPQPGTEREAGAETNASPNNVGNPPYENETFTRVTEAPITTPAGRPGRRLKNPLGSLASYTYQLSLYMITAPAYEAFTANGRRNINLFAEEIATSAAGDASRFKDGAFLIAQSGGIGADDARAPGFEYDYYIDGLTFKHYVNSNATGAPVAATTYKFQITEPYGFSLLTKLRQAKDTLATPAADDTGTAAITPRDPLSQFYILGIRFFGWDSTGIQVTGSEVFDGNPLDPSALGNGEIFESFYDIIIKEVKFKIDGRATVYNIEAESASIATTINVRKGMVPQSITVSGSTVRDYLSGPNGLFTKLNKQQQDLVNNNTITYPVVYKVNWLGDAENIATSSVLSDARTDKGAETGSDAENTTQVNEETATRASPNNTSRDLSIANIPVVQAIDQIVAMSKYLQDAISFNYTDSNENNPERAAPNVVTTPNNKFTWFQISPEISNIQWDPKINDWSYDITYTIQTYLIPNLDNPFVNNNTPYYGPHKRYDYWYTGQNAEVLKFELEINKGFFNIVTAGSPRTANPSNLTNAQGTGGTGGGTNATANEPSSPAITATNTTSPTNSDGAGATLSMETINSVRTTLYDPGAYAKAKVEILGDPDFLMQPSPNLGNAVARATSYDRFYSGGGFTVNPNGGQVFFELDFKEAVDYSASGSSESFADGRGVSGTGGTLSINDSINFVNYPNSVNDKINGVVYMLTEITHSFKNGAFTQTLEANQPFLNSDITKLDPNASQREPPTPPAVGSGAPPGAPGENANTGTVTDPATAPPAAIATTPAATTPAATTPAATPTPT
jgi:hypothetical protein